MADQQLWDFFQALTQPGRRSTVDELSALDQLLGRKKFAERQNETGIMTIDPGITWNGYDKNAIRPDDLMSDIASERAYRRYRQDDI